MKKKMECKALGEVKYRSNLMVVRILTRRVTPQSAFSSPRLKIEGNLKLIHLRLAHALRLKAHVP